MGKDINHILKLWSSLSPGQIKSNDNLEGEDIGSREEPDRFAPEIKVGGVE